MKAIVFDNYKDKFDKINEYLNVEKINFESIRFRNGEGKIVIKGNTFNEDIIIFSDFNNSKEYTYLNKKRNYSKDEYYVELKRVISAIDKAKSISVFLPLMYESRQNANKKLESKDFLMFVSDLKNMGVDNIVTFELHGNHQDVKSYSLSPLLREFNYDIVVSPDEGGVERSKKYSEVLKCDNKHFMKIRDLNSFIDGANPIEKYDSDNCDFKNKNVLIVDDILDSGETLIKALEIIEGAKKVDIFVAYPLFLKGVKKFKEMIKKNKLNKIYISDLISIDKRILKCKFIEVIDTSKLISDILIEVIK